MVYEEDTIVSSFCILFFFKAHLHYIRRLTELSCTSGSLGKFLFDPHARKTYQAPAKRIDIRVSSTAVKLNSSTTIFQRQGSLVSYIISDNQAYRTSFP